MSGAVRTDYTLIARKVTGRPRYTLSLVDNKKLDAQTVCITTDSDYLEDVSRGIKAAFDFIGVSYDEDSEGV